MTQSSDFDSSAVTNLIGLWDFSQGATTHDTGLADGLAQNGEFAGNAYASGGKAYFDGSGDRFDVRGEDATFDGDQGTIEVQFSRAGHVGSDPDTLVNRGEAADAATEGYFNIAVTSNGAVRVTHVANGEEVALTSLSGLAGIGQTVNVKYSWDAETGGQLIVQNLSTGASQTLNHAVTGLDMDIGDNDDERFTFGAREFDDGAYDQYFKGSISHVAVYDSLMPELDGVVEGTVGNDTIDIAYTGDPEGDRIVFDGDSARTEPNAVSALGLTLHEFATNASKYGALSNDGGTITVSWRHDEDRHGRQSLVIEWVERGGPPIHRKPEETGTGFDIAERLLSYSRGTLDRAWEEDGLHATISLPLTS